VASLRLSRSAPELCPLQFLLSRADIAEASESLRRLPSALRTDGWFAFSREHADWNLLERGDD
jgi:hypothetical protein